MGESKINPEKITKPIQLLAAWFAALVLLVGVFLGAAFSIPNPSWLQAIFGITAVVIVPVFILAIFLIIKGKSEGIEISEQVSAVLKSEGKRKTENINEDLDKLRIKRYQENNGVFLVHTTRPSLTPGQVADIAISLCQHGKGPLTEGKVKYVEYSLGPKFFEYPVIKTNLKDNFKLDVSAYAPMLCVARVYFTDSIPPIELERYINF